VNSSVGAVAAPARQIWTALALLWLAGLGLRLTLLAVPPLIPIIHAELGLSETEIGTLGTLPSLLLAAAAIPGSLLIARFGATTALVVGLLLVGLGSAARGGANDIIVLYLTTMITSAGVAIMQPAMPPLVRAWVPERVPFATALYTNGLLVAETLAVALTIPIVLPLAGGSWRLVTLPSGAGSQFSALWAVDSSGESTWAAGTQFDSAGGIMRTLMIHGTGDSWTVVQTPDPGAPSGDDSVLGGVVAEGDTWWAVGHYKDNGRKTLIEKHSEG